MGLFDFFGSSNKADINALVSSAKQTAGASIVDVRTPEEYAQGHIEGAINIPLDSIDKATKRFPDTATPLYLYCLSGARSSNAASYLKKQGYTNITNMGGIRSWSGTVVKGSK
ncbi:MAG: rhodanese-like domain-containing protein [Eggerthellaceae bacterium]